MMILILAQAGCEEHAEEIQRAVTAHDPPTPPSALVDDPASWTQRLGAVDLLILVYNSPALNASERALLDAYLRERQGGDSRVLPVTIDANLRTPPHPLETVKSSVFRRKRESASEVARDAAVLLGLEVSARGRSLFISYASRDGTDIAQDLQRRLHACGYSPWLDEASPDLHPGADVEEAIREALARAAMLIVIDTPAAGASSWVQLEIDLANGQAIPVLPIVVGRQMRPRFNSLSLLQRWITVNRSGAGVSGLDDGEWLDVRREIEDLLRTTDYRSKYLPTRVRTAFEGKGFAWNILEEKRRMYLAIKERRGPRPDEKVLSHCSIHDPKYIAALRVFAEYLRRDPNVSAMNHKIYWYDRDIPLTDPDGDDIKRDVNLSFRLAHYGELNTILENELR